MTATSSLASHDAHTPMSDLSDVSMLKAGWAAASPLTPGFFSLLLQVWVEFSFPLICCLLA